MEDDVADDEERDCFADFSDFEYENSELGYPIDSAMARGSEEVKVSREGFAADFGFVGFSVLLGGGAMSAMGEDVGEEAAAKSFTGIDSCARLASSGAVR